jgi:hypothetical protein
MLMNKVTEAISLESDLLLKLKPLSEVEIFEFMKNLRGGTYFNMGMYSSIPVSRAYKSTIRIYKVIDLTAIVSGVSYENVGTTKEFRDRTGEAPGKSWYDHTPGFENKVGQKKSDPNSKYVLWDIKRGTGTCVRYYVVDIDTSVVTPVSKADIEASPYLTATEKAKLTPKPVVGFDLNTGEAVENKTVWRTAAFEHIFWLNQAGKATQEYGVRFEEDFDITEAADSSIFMDAHAHVRTDLDAILSGEMIESVEKPLEEDTDLFMDAYAGVETKLDDILSGAITEDGINPETWTEKTAPDEIYVILTGDGPEYENVFLTFDDEGDYYTTVDYLDEVGIWDLHQSISEAIRRAKDADSSTFGGWPEEIHIAKVTNFKDAFFNQAEPEYTVVKTLTDADLASKSSVATTEAKSLEESYRRTVSRGALLVENELFVDFD